MLQSNTNQSLWKAGTATELYGGDMDLGFRRYRLSSARGLSISQLLCRRMSTGETVDYVLVYKLPEVDPWFLFHG